MNNKRSGGKIPSFNFISQTLKDIGRIYQRKNHDPELISILGYHENISVVLS